jgi:nicotinamide-nucleotide amidase
MGESALAEAIRPILEDARSRSPGLAAMFVHYRASYPEVLLVLEATPDEAGRAASEDELASLDPALAAALGEAFVGTGPSTLEERLVHLLSDRGLTIATAESCTGGAIGDRITSVAGASQCFRGGVIAYANAVKVAQLGVPSDVLERHGAVSEPVARAMAEGARAALGSDLAIAATGIAGPSGGTPDKPVGTVDFAVSDARGTTYRRVRLHGNRGTVLRAATTWALKLVLDRIRLTALRA